jgi:hypothetical protein
VGELRCCGPKPRVGRRPTAPPPPLSPKKLAGRGGNDLGLGFPLPPIFQLFKPCQNHCQPFDQDRWLRSAAGVGERAAPWAELAAHSLAAGPHC